MKLARRLARRAASRKLRRAAIKDQNRRGFFAERLEDRTLMAADINTAFHNYAHPTDVDGDNYVTATDVLAVINNINAHGSHTLPAAGTQGESSVMMVDVDGDGEVTASDVIRVINFINAEGEVGSTLPNKANYTLHILDATGKVIDASQVASIQKDSDFYVQLVGKDLRSTGSDTTVSPSKALARGIQAAFTDITYLTPYADVVTNESQGVALNYDVTDPLNPPPTFMLTLPSNASGKSGTTAAITIATKPTSVVDPTPVLDTVVTATNIQNALDATLFGGTKNGAGTKVFFNGASFTVIFTGINNLDLPLMTGIDSTNSSANITINEIQSGATTIKDASNNDVPNTLAAVQYETDATGAERYPNDHLPFNVVGGYGIDDVGGFSGASTLGVNNLQVFRIHMVARLPVANETSKQVVFTPDPLGDGSGNTDDMLRPKHNTLVYGNDNIKDIVQNNNNNGPGLFTVSDAAATPLQFNAAASASSTLSSVDGFYDGKQVRFTTAGKLFGSARAETVVDYVGATHTFIFGGTGFKDTNGIPTAPNNGDAFQIESTTTTESEKSLVQFSLVNNEFILTPVTLNINSGPVHADAFSPADIVEDSGADTIPVIPAHAGVNQGQSGTAEIKSVQGLPASAGTVSISGNNVIYTPAADFNGQAIFTYTVGLTTDLTDTPPGTKFATNTITVNVLSKNDVPTLGTINNVTIDEDTPTIVNLSGISPGLPANESGQTVTITATSSNPGLIANPVTANYTTGATGTLSFTPVLNQSGTATITVTAQDNGGTANGGTDSVSRTFTVTVNAVNDAPVNTINGTDANGQHVVAVPNSTNSPLAGFNSTDVDLGAGTLTVTLTAAAGTLSVPSAAGVTGNNSATVVIAGSQSFVTTELAGLTYTPVALSTSPTTLTFSSNDGGSTGSGGTKTTTSTVTIDLDPGFRPGPIADAYSVNEGATDPIILDVVFNDFTREKDGTTGTTVIASIGSQPAHGHVDIVDAGGNVVASNGVKLKFTPPAGVTAADNDFFTPGSPLSFTYTLSDGVTDTKTATTAQATGTVSVRVVNVPDAPVAVGNDGPYGAAFDSSAAIQTPLVVSAANGVLTNDTDVDNIVPNYATLTAVLEQTTHRGTLVLNADGSFTYTPAAGTGDDSFTYHVKAVTPESGSAGVISNTVTVNIHVTTPPTATNDHFNVLEQGNPASSGNVLTGAGSNPASAADSDDSDHQGLTAVNMVQLQDPNTVGTVTLNTDGSFSYAPPAGQNFNTTRPGAPDISFTYQAKTTDGRLSHVATVALTVQDVNDPPTAVDDVDFLAVKNNGSGTIGLNQEVTVLTNDSIAPDVAIGGDEFKSVSGISATNGGFGTTDVLTAHGGIVHLVGGKIFYDSPSNGYTGPDSFFYQLSDNSAGTRNPAGPLFASAQVSFNVVDFVPKTISGTVYVDSNADGLFQYTDVNVNQTYDAGDIANEKVLAGVTVHLKGTAFDGTPLDISTTTDASGRYTFPAAGSNVTIKPPLIDATHTGYVLSEDQPQFMISGVDNYQDFTPNNDTNTDPGTAQNPKHTGLLVSNLDIHDNAFLLAWSVTDISGNLTDLNFGEGGAAGLINVDPNNGGLSNASGFKSELLASTGKNGFIAAVDLSGNVTWSWTIEGDAGAWAGHALGTATLSADLSTLTVKLASGQTQTLTQGYLSSTSTARFRILGSGLVNGETQYIIRIDASYDGSTGTFSNGVTDAMFQVTSLQAAGAQGEAPVEGNYAHSADAVFANQAWA